MFSVDKEDSLLAQSLEHADATVDMLNNILHKMGLVKKSEAESVIESLFSNRAEAAYDSPLHETSKEPLAPEWSTSKNLERVQLIKEVRDLEENFAPIGLAVREMARNVIPIAYMANTGDKAMDSRVNDYLNVSMMAENFDYSQVHDAFTAWELAVKDALIDGDQFQQFVKPRNEPGFYVRAIRSDLIGANEGTEALTAGVEGAIVEPKKLANGQRKVGGVIIDQRGRRIGYEKYRYNPSFQSYDYEKRIPSASILQIFDPQHSDTVRGVTPFKAAALNMRDLKEIFDYTKASIKFASSKPVIIRNESGKAPAARGGNKINLSTGTTSGDCSSCKKSPCTCPPPTREVDGVSVWYLKLKERVESFTVDNPGASFKDMAQFLLTSGAMSLDLPYSVLYDTSVNGGAGLRIDLSKAANTFNRYAHRVVLARMIDPWKRAKLQEGIDRGILRGITPDRFGDLCRGSWVMPPDATADEKYSSATFLNLVREGYVSAEDVCALKGKTHAMVTSENSTAEQRIIEAAKELHTQHPEMPLSFWIDRLASNGAPNGSLPYEQSLQKPEQAELPFDDPE